MLRRWERPNRVGSGTRHGWLLLGAREQQVPEAWLLWRCLRACHTGDCLLLGSLLRLLLHQIGPQLRCLLAEANDALLLLKLSGEHVAHRDAHGAVLVDLGVERFAPGCILAGRGTVARGLQERLPARLVENLSLERKALQVFHVSIPAASSRNERAVASMAKARTMTASDVMALPE